MSIQIGDKIPSVILKTLTADGLEDQTTDSVFENKKVVMFAVPGAFTPTCTAKHLPGFVKAMPEFQADGVDVVCLAVNDPFVMNAWAKACNAATVTMLADGNATFTKALGLEMDGRLRPRHPRPTLRAVRRERRRQGDQHRQAWPVRGHQRRSHAESRRRTEGGGLISILLGGEHGAL